MTRKNSRHTAIEVLLLLENTDTVLPVLFNKICTEQEVQGMDRSLAMKLIYGALRQKQYLELIISQLCTPPLKKLHPAVRYGLMVGLYQLLFLDRIPDSAAVNETMKAVKKTNMPKRLYGFVNGVLRQAIRRRENLPNPNQPQAHGEPVLNHPKWMTERWRSHFGRDEMLAICKANNEQQPLNLRINRGSISPEAYISLLEENDIEGNMGNYSQETVILHGYQGTIEKLPGYTEGYFQVQGEAAQLATLLLGPFRKNGRYLDGCAGLGGKTGHLLQLIGENGGVLQGVEPELQRSEKLKEVIAQHPYSESFSLFSGTLQNYENETEMKFDGILIDAPCSGTGVTGRQPDIRWRRKKGDIERFSTIQIELLNTAVRLLKPGGVLVYSTCSLEPEENLQTINKFLQDWPNLHMENCADYLPSSASPLIREGCFQPRPSDGCDGFFAARLVSNIGDD